VTTYEARLLEALFRLARIRWHGYRPATRRLPPPPPRPPSYNDLLLAWQKETDAYFNEIRLTFQMPDGTEITYVQAMYCIVMGQPVRP
jgi:hypothetical protein